MFLWTSEVWQVIGLLALLAWIALAVWVGLRLAQMLMDDQRDD